MQWFIDSYVSYNLRLKYFSWVIDRDDNNEVDGPNPIFIFTQEDKRKT